MMSIRCILTSTVCGAALLAAFGAVTVLSAPAQQLAGSPTPSTKAVYVASSMEPSADALSSSSSSSSDAEETSGERLLSSAGTLQPPPRPRYGRPRYHDSNTNADGSSKWTFIAGGGVTMPVSTTSNDLTTGYRFQAGGGRNFNKKFGVLLQFDYDHNGFQTSTLNNLLAIYNSPYVGGSLPQLNGTSHVWSFTLNPIYTIAQGDTWGSYIVGGVGFYHKVADFTTPGTGEECDPFYGCFEYTANEVVDSYVSNAPGFNGGGGMTYKLSRFSSERLFVEARYVYVNNSPRSYTGTTAANTPTGSTAFDAFPQNGNHTTYIPVTFGIRF